MLMLNCDLGESHGSWKMGRDDEVMPHIDQANIACGFHGGDPLVMQKTLALASVQPSLQTGRPPMCGTPSQGPRPPATQASPSAEQFRPR